MKDSHKALLTRFRPKLVDDVSIGGLLTHLEALDVLTTKLVATIKAKPTTFDQVEELLDILRRRDDNAFDLFCQALERNGDKHLASLLRNPSKNPPKGATSGKRGRKKEDEDEDGLQTPSISKKKESRAKEEEDEDEDENDLPTPPISKKKKVSDAEPIKKPAVYARSADHEDLFVLFNLFTEERKGTLKDQASLKAFFKGQLKFTYKPYQNCSKEALLTKLDGVASDIRESGEKYNSLVVAVLSHGDEKGIKTCKNGNEADGEYITMDEICQIFKSSSLKELNDCPKVFIVQACRGKKDQQGTIRKDDQSAEGVVIKDIDRHLTTPHDADILISYSTTEGYYSNRYPDGTPYIQKLVSILKEFYQEEHLVDMITRLHDEIADLDFGGGDKQMPCMVSSLRKRVYFHSLPL